MSRRLSEDELIARFFAPYAGPAGLGLRDDAALLTPPAGCDLVLTTDALVAGVHFFADDAPAAIARKALRVNLSDLAAKGARPLGFLLSLALPADWTEAWLAAFAAALGDDGALYGCPLAGGDTVKTPGPLTLSIAAFGAVPSGRMAARTGVRPGDRLYVTGTIGDAAIGLRLRQGRDPDLTSAERKFLVGRYLEPQPRVALAPAMAAHANGGMDVSDGFVGDLTKMLRVSGGQRPRRGRPAAAVAGGGGRDRRRSRAFGGRPHRRRRLRDHRLDSPEKRGRLRGGGRRRRRARNWLRRSGRGRRSAALRRARRRDDDLRPGLLQSLLRDER